MLSKGIPALCYFWQKRHLKMYLFLQIERRSAREKIEFLRFSSMHVNNARTFVAHFAFAAHLYTSGHNE